MRLSTSTNIYFNRPQGKKVSIQESIQACAQAGYKVLDLNFHDCTTFRLPFVSEQYQLWVEVIGQLIQKEGITFNQCHSSFYNFCDNNYPNREFMDKMVRRAVECAGLLNIPYVVIHAGSDYESAQFVKSSKSKNYDYFMPLIEFAEKSNTSLVFENLWDLEISPLRRYTANAEELVDFVDSFNTPTVGICYDTDHATLMGQSHKLALEYIGKRLVATHVSDCISPTSDHLLPYDGRTDWTEVTSTLKAIDYQGDITFEIHRYTQNLPDELIQSALQRSIQVGNYLISLCQ